ncbi:hypothetical protein ACOMHN_025075 [Nucella lapillus]
MENKEEGEIELITEWPVISSHIEEDSDLSTASTSENGHPGQHKPQTGQHFHWSHLRLGKRHYSDLLSSKHLSDHSHETDPVGSPLETEGHDGKSWKGDFPRNTLKHPRMSASLECAEKSALTEGNRTELGDLEYSGGMNCIDSNSLVVNERFHPAQNNVDRSVRASRACVRDIPDQKTEASAHRELLAQPRIARWWRRHGRQLSSTRGQEKITLPMTTNPNTLLFHVARLPEGRAFLIDERQKLKKQAKVVKGRGDVLAALGSLEEWLGNPDEAVQCLKQALATEPDNKEWRWLLHKAQRQQKVKCRQREMMSSLPLHPVFPAMRQVERRSCRDLSFADFFRQYAACRRPVVITDTVFSMTTVPWDLRHIRQVAGECPARVKRSVQGSVEWAGLEESRLVRVSEFLDSMEQGCGDYLFDWSLPLHCPALAGEITIPRYFAGDFLQRSSSGSLYQDSWPSLFIAPAGVHSGLHVDAFASNFWMALFQGRKRWVFFQEEDAPCLYPVYAHSMDPTFEADMVHPDLTTHPLLASVHPVECVLNAGELLFVPGGSPHYVENLDATLAISANFVDLSNFTRVKEELDISALLDPRAADLAQQFRQPSFESTMKEDMGDLPWKEFKTWPPPDLDSYCLKSCECNDNAVKLA